MFSPEDRLPEFRQRNHEVKGTSEHGNRRVREPGDGFVMSLVGEGLGQGSAHRHCLAVSAMAGARREAAKVSYFVSREDGVTRTSPVFLRLARRAMRSGQVRGEVSKEFSGEQKHCL